MRLTKLLPLTLLAIASVALAGPIRFQEDFSQPGNWAGQSTASHIASVEGGKLRLRSSELGKTISPFRQAANVGPAASWKASADYRFEKFNPQDKVQAASLIMYSPTGEQTIYTDLRPDGHAAIYQWTDKWITLLPMTRASSFRSGESNTVTLERESGYFTLSVNNVFVGRTPIVDFSPRGIGVSMQFNSPAEVEIDNLKLDETGLDSRYARLLGLQATPSARMYIQEDFSRKPNQNEVWWVGKDDLKTGKIENGRYFMQGATDNKFAWAIAQLDTSARGYFDGYSGLQVTGKFSAPSLKFGTRGIAMVGEPGRNGELPTNLTLAIGFDQFMVFQQLGPEEFPSVKKWTFSHSISPDTENSLSMAKMPDDRVLVFINGEYQTTVKPIRGFPFSAVGLVVWGLHSFTADDVFSAEF